MAEPEERRDPEIASPAAAGAGAAPRLSTEGELAALAARYLDLWDRAGPDLRAEPPAEAPPPADDSPHDMRHDPAEAPEEAARHGDDEQP